MNGQEGNDVETLPTRVFSVTSTPSSATLRSATFTRRRTTAEVAAERVLDTHPRLSGVFAANDLMALGVADTVHSAGNTADVTIIGLDGIAEALDAIRSRSIGATVSQYPYVMGQTRVESFRARLEATHVRLEFPNARQSFGRRGRHTDDGESLTLEEL